MRALKIYLDTSVISFLYADDAPEKQDITKEIFNKYIRTGIYDTYISNVVIQELQNTPDLVRREKLLTVLNEYPIDAVTLQISDEIEFLASIYVEAGIIPVSKMIDALHVAIAVVNDLDILLSWNYRHMANIHRERKILGANALHGYSGSFRIITPYELIDYE